MNKIIIIMALLVIALRAGATELVHQFNSPAFSGVGYSSHVLTIEQLEATRRQKLREEEANRLAKAELAAKQTNIAKFLVNVESRIYAQLSKQLADSLFSGGGTTGSLDFQGTNISWVKTSTDVTMTILESNGNRTEITVPLASFAF
jgi:hypothetical protein